MTQVKISAETRYVRDALLAFDLNEKMNQVVLDQLNPAAWNLKPSGSRTRTIAAILAHVHNVRCKWIRLSAPHLKLPAMLDRACNRQQVRTSLKKSDARCREMIEEALNSPPDRAPHFIRDGWARPWPAGVMMVAYMITHEAHHRGQICMLAHQLGYPLSASTTSTMWNWEKIQKQCTVIREPRSQRAQRKA